MRAFIIFALIAYTVYKVFKFLFKGSVSVNKTSYGGRSTESNVDFKGQSTAKPKENRDFKGGEYIDYEEVD